jgi:hypothetical protein
MQDLISKLGTLVCNELTSYMPKTLTDIKTALE